MDSAPINAEQVLTSKEISTNLSPKASSSTTDPHQSSPKSSESKKSPSDTAANRRKRKPKKVSNVENTSDCEMIDLSLPTKISPLENIAAIKDTKIDSDECETIDKIAKMVSNITSVTATVIPAESSDTNQQQQNLINEVENRLEEMFADDANPQKEGKVDKSSEKTSPPVVIDAEQKPEQQIKVATKPKAPPRKRKTDGNSKVKKKNANVNGKASGSKGKTGDKGKQSASKGQKPKENQGGKSRKDKTDVAPYLQIQKDGSFNIINQTINGDDDTDKANSKSKKPPTVEKHKNIRGLHVSILSNKYDAEKRDLNWICVFCKLGPHKFKLGDLFGPYIVSRNSKEYSLCLEDPANDVFRQGNRNKFAPITSPNSLPKKKRKNSDGSARNVTSPSTSTAATNSATTAVNGPEVSDEVFMGMTPLDEQKLEIWFHEDCIVWSPSVYIVGTKIIGLEQAVWQSTRHRCGCCQKNGAMIACLSRACKKEAHVFCARKTWQMCDDFKTYCDQHMQHQENAKK